MNCAAFRLPGAIWSLRRVRPMLRSSLRTIAWARNSASLRSSRSCLRKRACSSATLANSVAICKMSWAALAPICACSKKRAATWCLDFPRCVARYLLLNISVNALRTSSNRFLPNLMRCALQRILRERMWTRLLRQPRSSMRVVRARRFHHRAHARSA